MSFVSALRDRFPGLRTHQGADKLPADAREKMITLRSRANEAGASNSQMGVDRDELREMHAAAQSQLSERESNPVRNEGPIKQLKTEIAKLTRELSRLEAQRVRVSELAGASNLLVEKLEAYVRGLNSPASAFRGSVEAKILANESTAEAIERRRRRIRELAADRAQVEAAPIPSVEAKRASRIQIDELAERGRPNVFDVLQAEGGKLQWPTITDMSPLMNGPSELRSISVHADALGILAWLHRADLVAAIDRQIAECADDTHALSAADRASKLKVVRDDKLATEREEELLISQAEASGAQVARRPDADPRAVLGLSDDQPGYEEAAA